MGGGDKTERATAKRRRDERNKGNVFQSKEITTLVGLLAVLYAVQFMGTVTISTLRYGIQHFWSAATTVTGFTAASLRATLVQGVLAFGASAGVPLLVAGLVAVLTTLVQTKGLVKFSQLRPKFGKMNPLSGIKRMFSVRGLVELLKSLLKVIILGYVIYNHYVERAGEFPRLMEMEFPQVLSYTGTFLMDLVMNVAVIFAFLAVADYIYQRWQYEKDMRMSKQEIKEEFKQTEGDPKIKGKIRQKQREMSMGRMMENVPEADVVIRNPTHFAVAVRYEAGKDRAPVVLAKGMDYVALRIIRAAQEAGVTIVENRPLARGLHDGVPLDREIPEEFFQPVAEILAFVYSTAKKEKNPVGRH